MAAKVVKTGRQWFVKLKEKHQRLLEQVLLTVSKSDPRLFNGRLLIE
jgi:hypothetical protein